LLAVAKPAATPSEPVKVLARPLVSEATRDNEPVRDLKIEDFSEILETEDREPDRDLVRPLASEAASDNEPVKALVRPLL
jgi:hypothetical protein